MCGIVASFGNFDLSENIKILDKLYERGPDGKYSKNGSNFFLGLSRLAIVSPEDHEIPFINITNNIFCIVNGEIYNFKELKCDLIKKGYIFRTNIDTEVALHAYEEFGNNFVQKLNGIFAIIIYDKRNELFFVARDHLGVKPLYYTKKRQSFYLCSSAKLLAKNITPISSIDSKNLIKQYYRQSVPEPNTIFEGVYSIPSGSFAIIQNNKIRIEKYFKIETVPKEVDYDIEEYLEIFKRAINKQSCIDTNKVGIAQSDGIDSMLLGKLLDFNQITGFHVPYDQEISTFPNNNILSYEVANIDYRNFVNEAYSDWIQLCDQPPMDGFNTFLLCYKIKLNIKVLYSGIGADELFNGYPNFNHLQMATSKEELIIDFLNITKVFPDSWLIKIADDYGIKFGDVRNELFHDIITEVTESVEGGNLIRELLIKFYLIPCLLRDADANSMYNSIELRVPYLDINVLKYSLSYNYNSFLKNNENKCILKESLNKLIGFNYNINKEGFTLKYNSFLKGSDYYFSEEYDRSGYRMDFKKCAKVVTNK